MNQIHRVVVAGRGNNELLRGVILRLRFNHPKSLYLVHFQLCSGDDSVLYFLLTKTRLRLMCLPY